MVTPCQSQCPCQQQNAGYFQQSASAIYQGAGVAVKPFAVAAGYGSKMIGSATSLVGTTLTTTGQKIQEAAQVLKKGALGGVGLGAGMMGWGLDPKTISNQLEADPQVMDSVSSVLKPIDSFINGEHPAAATSLPMTEQAQTESTTSAS